MPAVENRNGFIADSQQQLCFNFAIQNHQEFLMDKYINEAKQSSDYSSSNSRERVFQDVIAKLQAEIKDGEKDLSNLPSIRNDLAKAVAEAEEK